MTSVNPLVPVGPGVQSTAATCLVMAVACPHFGPNTTMSLSMGQGYMYSACNWTKLEGHKSYIEPNTVHDIWSGETLRKDAELQSNRFLALGISTDGVALFKSSKSTLWPVYLVIQNLPPQASSHAEIEGHAKFTRQEMRILTATAQGIQHWSKFHHISCLLFEVFVKVSYSTSGTTGSLNSAVTMEGSNAKQFVLKTPDGVMRHFIVSNRIATCLHWYEDIPSGLLGAGMYKKHSSSAILCDLATLMRSNLLYQQWKYLIGL
eukprot:Em0015g326a